MPRSYDDDDSDEFDIRRRPKRFSKKSKASSLVAGPALSMMICALISFACLVVYCPINLFVVINEPQGQFKQQEERVGEFLGAVVIVPGMAVGNLVIAFGAYQMKTVSSYGMAMTAAVMSVIPCVSRCCIIGIPFGIWALMVLNDPKVRSGFDAKR